MNHQIEQNDCFRQALNAMDEELRWVLSTYLEGYTIPEIATKLETSERTIGHLLVKAKNALNSTQDCL